MIKGFCKSIIIVDGFSMVFQISIIVINGFFFIGFTIEPLPLNEWFITIIDIDGLSMVLGKVKAGSQKRPKRKKKKICSTKKQR